RLVATAFPGAEHVLRIRVMPSQLPLPALQELLLVLYLAGLDATVLVSSMRDAFVMDHFRERRVVHLLASSTNLEGQVGIFAISGSVELIEGTDLLEQGLSHQQRRPGTVVGFAHIVEARL